MEIGEEGKPFIVEPLEDPFEQPEPAETPSPVEVPEREAVPA